MATLRRWSLPSLFRRRAVSTPPKQFDEIQSFSENSDVSQALSAISRLIQSVGVPWCVVGDVLLTHYLVPRVIRDIEICVQSENFKQVEALFNSSFGFCFRIQPDPDSTPHPIDFPCFRFSGTTQFCFYIVPSTHYGLTPRAFSDLLLDQLISGFPLLPLPRYVQGLASVLTSQTEENKSFAVQIECLIEGMDLDNDWCGKYLDGTAQEYVRSRRPFTAEKARVSADRDDNLTRKREAPSEVIGRTMETPSNSRHTFPIQIMSDLHLEFQFWGPGDVAKSGYDAFDCKPCAPILALLGDIGLVSQDGLFVFLRRQLLKYEKVLYVLGNHEFYQSSHEEAKARMKQFADEIKKQQETPSSEHCIGEFILMDQTRLDLDANVTILGCTLWSHIPSTASKEVGMRLNDFRRIRQWTVETHNAAHLADAAWLDTTCASIKAEEPDRRIIVLTHYAPAMSGTSARRHENVGLGSSSSDIRTGFATDMSVRSCWRPPLAMWAFGHTHFCCDFERDGVRVVSNQRGYEGIETRFSSFRDDFVLDV